MVPSANYNFILWLRYGFFERTNSAYLLCVEVETAKDIKFSSLFSVFFFSTSSNKRNGSNEFFSRFNNYRGKRDKRLIISNNIYYVCAILIAVTRFSVLFFPKLSDNRTVFSLEDSDTLQHVTTTRTSFFNGTKKYLRRPKISWNKAETFEILLRNLSKRDVISDVYVDAFDDACSILAPSSRELRSAVFATSDTTRQMEGTADK